MPEKGLFREIIGRWRREKSQCLEAETVLHTKKVKEVKRNSRAASAPSPFEVPPVKWKRTPFIVNTNYKMSILTPRSFQEEKNRVTTVELDKRAEMNQNELDDLIKEYSYKMRMDELLQ